MWAKWPSDVTVDQLVADAAKLNAWFADIDKIVTYLRDTRKTAESYKASMAGKMGDLLNQVKARQDQILSTPLVDPIANLKNALTEKANTEKDPIIAQISRDKVEIADVQKIVDRAKADLAPLQAQYATLVAQFSSYRATEATETATYTQLAQQASTSTLDNIADAEIAIANAARDASSAPNDLTIALMRLFAQVQFVQRDYGNAMAYHSDFVKSHGASVPDLTSGALRSLNGMLAYVRARSARSDATANSLLDGIVARRQALITLKVDATTRDTIAQSQLLAASTAFNDEANARITELWKTPPTSTVLKLPYLAERYDMFTTFLQMQPLCDATSSWWRETGCIALRRNFNTAQSYLTTTMPTLMRLNVSTMRTKGVDAVLLDAVIAKLNAGDVKGATVAYDAAVRSSEGT